MASFAGLNLALAPRTAREGANKTLVWLKLEYAAPIWRLYLTIQINQIEKVQRKAAHWTCKR